jgi:Family of unknown function (DUF5670)
MPRRGERNINKKEVFMRNLFWVIALVLIVLFLLGLVTHILGGLIYILLVVALIFAIIWLVQRINFKKL